MMELCQSKNKNQLHIYLVFNIIYVGYAGYVHAIKPENIHANTFGKVTYDVRSNNYVRGQDIPPS